MITNEKDGSDWRQNCLIEAIENEMLVLLHEDGEINEDEVLILNHANQRRNLHKGLPYWKYDRFNVENMQEDECEVDFWVKKPDIY